MRWTTKFGIHLLSTILAIGGLMQNSCGAEIPKEYEKVSYQFRDGDVIIGGAIEVHRHNESTGQCGELRAKGVQDVETINMLIDKVNANDSILPGIKLGSILIDTCAWPTHAGRQVVNHILPFVYSSGTLAKNKSVLAGVLGAGTSKVSLQIANLLQAFEIPQISHSSTSQELSDKALYPYFFRTVAPDWFQSRAMVQLAKEMDWNYVSVVYENDCYGRNVYLEFSRVALEQKVCIAQDIPIPSEPNVTSYQEIAKKLHEQNNAKVVIVITKSTPAEKVMSATQTLYKGKSPLLWVGSDGWASYLPKNAADTTYTETLDGSIAFKLHGRHQKRVDEYMTALTLAQRWPSGFEMNPWFSELLSLENGCSLGDSTHARNCSPQEKLNPTNFRSYDGLSNMVNAVEAFVLSLDAYHRSLCKGAEGPCKALSDKAGTNEFASGLYPFLKDISFPVQNGSLFSFDENQDGPPSYDIVVYKKANVINQKQQKDGWEIVGRYSDAVITWVGEPPESAQNTMSVCSMPCEMGQATVPSGPCCWECITCTKDQYVSSNTSRCTECPLGEEPNTEKTGCVAVTIREMDYTGADSIGPMVFGIVGVVCTVVVTIIFILYHKSPIIKASGREMSFFVLIGIALTFCNCFALTVRPTYVSCVASRIILAIGPTMIYAALLVKTVRIAIIFKYKTSIPRMLENSILPWWQIMITLGLMLIQIIVLVIWGVVKSAEPVIIYDAIGAFRSCPDIANESVFIGLVYPFLLVIICTVFASINRHVPTGFNETLLIGFTMYATCVIWVGFMPLFLANSSNTGLKVATVSLCLSFSPCTVLICLFGPRCYKVLFSPEQNTKEAVMSKPGSAIPESNGATTPISMRA